MRWLALVAIIGCSSRPPPAELGSGSVERPAVADAGAGSDGAGPKIIRVDSKTTHRLVAHEAPKPAQAIEPEQAIELSVAGKRHAVFEKVVAGKTNVSCKVRVYANADQKVEYTGDHGCDVRALAFTPDGGRLAIATPDKLALVDIASGKVNEHAIAGIADARWTASGLIVTLTPKPYERELAMIEPTSGTTRALGTTHGLLVDAAGERLVKTVVVEKNAVAPCPPADCFPAARLGYDLVDLRAGTSVRLAFPELSGWIVMASDGAVAIKSLYVLYVYTAAGEARAPWHIGFVGSGEVAALSTGGRYYALADDKQLRVYDAVAGALAADGWANARVRALAFDGDARLVAYTDRLVTFDLVKQ
jgi:hypothetical protein